MQREDKVKEIHDYVDKLDILACQEVLRYVRGVYDGAQSTKQQYGLNTKEPPLKTA